MKRYVVTTVTSWVGKGLSALREVESMRFSNIVDASDPDRVIIEIDPEQEGQKLELLRVGFGYAVCVELVEV